MADTKVDLWWEENIKENENELIMAGSIASKKLYDHFSFLIEDPKAIIGMYCIIFDNITKAIREQEKEYDNFSLDIADRLCIGYTTTSDEEDEKVGNFMIYMKNLIMKSSEELSSFEKDEDPADLPDDDKPTIELLTNWNATNIKEQADIIKEIASKSKDDISKVLDYKTSTHEIVFPIFCTVHDSLLCELALEKQNKKKSDVEMNVAGWFTVGIQSTDEGDDIYFDPSPSLKLKFKDDSLASGDE